MSKYVRAFVGARDDDIIKKMISSVDKEKMQTMMSIAASHLNTKKITIDMKMVDLYLELWADAKYDQYIIFGEKLKIEKEIETKMTVEEMSFEISNLCSQYPQYALLLKSINPEDYITNSFSGFLNKKEKGDDSFVFSMYENLGFKKGAKISSLLCNIIGDDGYIVERELGDGTIVKSLHSFEIELSKVLQTKMIKGRVCVSIDPLDYLMMSTNQHGWISCMSISPSCTGYNNILLSKIIDDATMVGFKCGDAVTEYKLDGFKFEYISMQARYTMFLDKFTGAVGMDNGYGGQNLKSTAIKNAIRELLVNAISEYSGTNTAWKSIEARQSKWPYEDLSYTDGVTDLTIHEDTMKRYKRTPYFDIGVKEIVCPRCGKKVVSRGNFICCNDKKG